MAGERTEQATQHRREKARKEGDILHSRELTAAAGTLAGVIALGVMSGRTIEAWREAFQGFLLLGIDPLGLVDLNLFPPGSPNAIAANGVNMRGIYTVGGHGVVDSGDNGAIGIAAITAPPDTNQVDPTTISALQLVNKILADPNYKPGEPVFLQACSTGRCSSSCGSSYAQQVSSLLSSQTGQDTSVVGGTTSTFSGVGAFNANPDGTANMAQPGSWQVYRAGVYKYSMSNQHYLDLLQ